MLMHALLLFVPFFVGVCLFISLNVWQNTFLLLLD